MDAAAAVPEQEQGALVHGVVVVVQSEGHGGQPSDLAVGLVRAQLVELDLSVPATTQLTNHTHLLGMARVWMDESNRWKRYIRTLKTLHPNFENVTSEL